MNQIESSIKKQTNQVVDYVCDTKRGRIISNQRYSTFGVREDKKYDELGNIMVNNNHKLNKYFNEN